MNPGSSAYLFLNHEVRASDLLTGAPLQNGDEIVNYAAYSFNGDQFTGGDYVPNEYPNSTNGNQGDRITFSGGKVRIQKTANLANTAPGGVIEFTLESTFTNDTGSPESAQVVIRDIMPEGIAYVSGSTTGASEPLVGTCADVDSSLTCDDAKNQVLI